MLVKFQQIHKSINEFTDVELSDFSILTGINGSGKTQLLQAIDIGLIRIDDINPKEILYFDPIKFKIENEGQYTRQQVTQEKSQAWEFFINRSKQPNNPLFQSLISFKSRFRPNEVDVLKQMCSTQNTSLLNLDLSSIESENQLHQKLQQYQNQIISVFDHKNLVNHPSKNSIFEVFSQFGSFFDEISEDEFKDLYKPVMLKDNFLPMALGKQFLEYRVKEFLAYCETIEKNPRGIVHDLESIAADEFRQKHGNLSPWDVLNEFLIAYGNFDYTLTFPKKLTMKDYNNNSDTPFIPKLINSDGTVSINYSDLSSGEQILFSLALCVLKEKINGVFPKILLLDEIDSSLHPSMIKNLFNVIENVLLKKNIKVILVTHSPTTISLAKEKSVYVVNKDTEPKIEKTTKNNALSILTEGYITIDEGIKFIDDVCKNELTIISEGYNIEYLKKSASFYAGSNYDKIDIIAGIENGSGDGQIRNLFDLFCRMSHDKKVLFVWDSDYTNSFQNINNTFGYVFPKNSDNKIAKRGVENMFDEKFFEEKFVTITRLPDGTKNTVFYSKLKNQFLEHMLNVGKREDFDKFKPLFEFINAKLL